MRRIFKIIFRKNPKIYWNYKHLFGIFSKFVMYLMKVHRVRVMEEEWDYLIILDACRYDYFKKYNNMKGDFKKKISRGSCTLEWLRNNFKKYYDDVVYVSANPYISNVEFHGFKGFEHFFKVEPVWDYGWDKETGTVHPRKVVEAALKVRKLYPNKRMIIHFLQPHAPYIGKTKISRREVNINNNTPKDEAIQEIWRLVINGKIPINELKKAYEDNLKLVLKEVQRLIEKLEGKIVVTSDHGECFGEWFVYSHPKGIYIKELVEVPWLIIEKEESKQREVSDKELIKKRIKKLRRTGNI